jgi:thiazole synthase
MISAESTIGLVVNGEPLRLPAGLSLPDLIAHLGLAPERVAIERNREIVPRNRWAETWLADGDSLEIVHFVGGG